MFGGIIKGFGTIIIDIEWVKGKEIYSWYEILGIEVTSKCKKEGLTVGDNCLEGLSYLHRGDLSFNNCFEAI